jgi:uracil-DNA glycosylase
MWDEFWDDRGDPWDYDPGPPHNRSWPRLFAATPDYRAIGVAVTGGEAFRWHFGPMFYRGRLGDDEVKVLLIGQEGAQDESLSHRSFTGGTGARMQYFLEHIGITESYLFLNTFVYPIFGQYNDSLQPLAQDERSPIVRHRHDILDYVAARNELRLVVAVGRAAKETVATWIKSHGGHAQPSRLHLADTGSLGPELKALGVLHPGGAARGGASEIIADFKSAIRRIERWADADPGWLPTDPDGRRLRASEYRYRSSPIPFRDLPFGSMWRLGRGGTSSNRKMDQRAIQVFSASGNYNGRGHTLRYSGDVDGSSEGYDASSGDLAYEPPKDEYGDYDRGPGRSFARLLQGGSGRLDWPDFSSLGLLCHPSFGFGPIYRGRLRRPSLLLFADQASHDDQFTGRALTGEAGQHLQAFLSAAGLDYRYGILRVLPVNSLTSGSSEKRAAVDHPATVAIYQEALSRSGPRVVVAVGPLSRRLVRHLDLGSKPLVEMKAYRQQGYATDWRRALAELRSMRYGKDLSRPSFDYGGSCEQIPRHDLPYGTLRWQATSGDRVQQASRSGRPSPDYFRVVMPRWAFELGPESLTAAQRRRLDPLRR